MFQTKIDVPSADMQMTEFADAFGEERLLGTSFINVKAATVIGWLHARLTFHTKTRVAFFNAHCANISRRDDEYAEALASAHAVLPDGSGIALGLRLRGRRLVANLNGTDLIPELCRRMAETGHAVFLLGGQQGVAEAAAATLHEAAPGLIVAGTHDGFFDPADEDALIRSINNSGADVLLVAMGVPRQDTWLARIMPRLNVTLAFGVGGLFDFLSHRIPRAPRFLRKAGLEWTYRFYQEPRRMFRRYALGNPAFVLRVLTETAPSPASMRQACGRAAKRAVDLAGAAGGLAVLLPLFLAVGLLIRTTSRGPALLRQTRIGKDGAAFTLYKFRSMYRDAEARRAALVGANQHGGDGVTFKIKRDPRITPVGRLIRKTSIDELPQLINVLKGEMSLVGPRPALPAEVARYTRHERRRLGGKPGLTGLWQVSGRSDLPFPRQVELDIDYLDHQSLAYDMSILARTVPAVLFARGAY